MKINTVKKQEECPFMNLDYGDIFKFAEGDNNYYMKTYYYFVNARPSPINYINIENGEHGFKTINSTDKVIRIDCELVMK